MAWVYIKQDNKKDMFLVATEAYESVFKKQGFKIVGNGENNAVEAQDNSVKKNIHPTAEKPSKRQYNKRSNVS